MRPDPETHLALAQLRPELKADQALGVDQDALDGTSHRQILEGALDGAFPAERINGRWYVKRADLPKIAELLGVMPKPRIGRPPLRRMAVTADAPRQGPAPAGRKPARAKRAIPSSNTEAAVRA